MSDQAKSSPESGVAEITCPVRDAYVSLLRLAAWHPFRANNQPILCALRDYVAEASGRARQEVHEECELEAIQHNTGLYPSEIRDAACSERVRSADSEGRQVGGGPLGYPGGEQTAAVPPPATLQPIETVQSQEVCMIPVKKERFTVKQFHELYPNDDACLHQVFLNRYAALANCPDCGEKFSFHKITGRKCYACAHCGFQLHPLANTIFHKSSTELKSWFFAIFLFSCSKNGVSAKELQRQLGVTYKCAHRMAKQIRKLFDESVKPLSGTIEVDETL